MNEAVVPWYLLGLFRIQQLLGLEIVSSILSVFHLGQINIKKSGMDYTYFPNAFFVIPSLGLMFVGRIIFLNLPN
jgi:hypothetical protein